MAEQKWTPKLVADRLEEAASTLRCLPREGPSGIRTSWPTVIREIHEAYGLYEAEIRPEQPSAEKITRMDECLEWLRQMDRDSSRLLWLRALKVPWKVIARKDQCDRNTAWRRWTVAILNLVERLSGRTAKIFNTGGKMRVQHLGVQQVQQDLL